jgi:hypothetical protein
MQSGTARQARWLLWCWLPLACAFPSFPLAPQLTIVEPADGSILATASDDAAAVSVRYALVGAANLRQPHAKLCLDLHKGPLNYYRGPILSREDAAFRPYASGCYAPGQPVTIQGLQPGSYRLAARALSADNAIQANATTYFGVSGRRDSGSPQDPSHAPPAERATEFVASYEWRAVRVGQSVPSGLEVRLELRREGDAAGRSRMARIPPTWRLQLYLGRRLGFFRMDVARHTTTRDIEAAASAHLQSPTMRRRLEASTRRSGEGEAADERGRAQGQTSASYCVEVWDASARLPPGTAEMLNLFGMRGRLSAKLTRCEAGQMPDETAPDGAATAPEAVTRAGEGVGDSRVADELRGVRERVRRVRRASRMAWAPADAGSAHVDLVPSLPLALAAP